jgi:hypothetical protein
MTQLKITTFNVEKLFNCTKVLNFYSHEIGSEKLELIGKLRVKVLAHFREIRCDI